LKVLAVVAQGMSSSSPEGRQEVTFVSLEYGLFFNGDEAMLAAFLTLF